MNFSFLARTRIRTTATLKLKDLKTGQETTMKVVPMTRENRQALWKARMEHEK